MASVGSSLLLSQRPPVSGFKVLSNNKGNAKLRENCVASCYRNIELQQQQQQQEACNHFQEEIGTQRRQILLGLSLVASSFNSLVLDVFAENEVPEGFRIYTDDAYKFKILIPQEWKVGAGEPNGFKSLTAFYPEEASSSNVTVLITGLGPDFTKIESFGKVDEFAETLVSGLDRSWQKPAGVKAKLIDSKASKGFYYIDYSLQNPGEGVRYLFSALGMSSIGYYNRLYTVTGQFLEEESEKYSEMIKKAVTSFRFI